MKMPACMHRNSRQQGKAQKSTCHHTNILYRVCVLKVCKKNHGEGGEGEKWQGRQCGRKNEEVARCARQVAIHVRVQESPAAVLRGWRWFSVFNSIDVRKRWWWCR